MTWGYVTDAGQKRIPASLVESMDAMVKDAVHPNGFLGLVQGTGKEPKDSQPVTYDKVPDSKILE